ncbi:MAG: hypothetical protein Tp132SUR00d2C45923861_24 [Prokaryotic dsDNA virus sp.]|nr:MAG: hypothetical protein Tp132SUR00d2C45923861_24 [Prokaryotic dsDNA virus sp.]|tara:strand:- start:27966 stop:28655 length:690 start_codon:yes stop_codon:yes gene_type:complete
MAQGGTIAQRITDLIGSIYSTEAAYEGDLINAAINEIADMLPKDVLLKYSKTPGVLTSNSEWLVEDKKILKVVRVDADLNGIERQCKEVDRAFFGVAGDSGSLYKATAHSPIYHEDSANAGAATLKILPEPTGSQQGKIWYFSYVANGTDSTGITQATVNTSLYLPSNLIHAICLKSSVNILKAYISNQVQDEEDIELMQMIATQMQLLEKDFMTEMQRYVSQEKPEGE